MRNCRPGIAGCLLAVLIGTAFLAWAQTPYQPKYPGDPARSDSEFIAMAYMRTLLRAQHAYKAKNGKYANSLNELVHTGTFTRRMVNPQQGDYQVSFHPHKDGFNLLMTPQHQDADHRSFFAKEDGVIHAEESTTAGEDSPKVK